MGNEERSGSPRAPDPPSAVPLEVLPLHSTNLLTVLDETGTILYESPSIERVLGFDQDELLGESVAEFFHPADREHVVGAFRAVVESNAHIVESAEYRHERADGSYLWVESVASSNPTPNGNYVVNTRDISVRKAREEDLEDSNARLNEFASVVSHDMKNPLNVAQGRLELAREECDSAHLDQVARAHGRMEALIDDLLTLARTGARVQEMEPVEVAALAEDCWRTVATDEAHLVVEIDRSVRADRSRLRQLLENLIGNAVTHGGDGVTVTIGELRDPDGFYVADDGPGVPDGTRERVFESGYSTREGGTGLGLNIVTEVAEAHGWGITLTESDAGGARFEVTGVEFQ